MECIWQGESRLGRAVWREKTIIGELKRVSNTYTLSLSFFFFYICIWFDIPSSLFLIYLFAVHPHPILNSFLLLYPSTLYLFPSLFFFFSFYLSLFSTWIDEFLHFLCFSLFLIPNFVFFFLKWLSFMVVFSVAHSKKNFFLTILTRFLCSSLMTCSDLSMYCLLIVFSSSCVFFCQCAVIFKGSENSFWSLTKCPWVWNFSSL